MADHFTLFVVNSLLLEVDSSFDASEGFQKLLPLKVSEFILLKLLMNNHFLRAGCIVRIRNGCQRGPAMSIRFLRQRGVKRRRSVYLLANLT